MIKVTLLSVLFGFFLTPKALLDSKEENIIGEWRVVKYAVFNDYLKEDEVKTRRGENLNSTYVFLRDNTGIQASSANKELNYKWHLDKSKEDLVLQKTSQEEADKFFVKSVSSNLMILEKHHNKQVVVSLVMKKL